MITESHSIIHVQEKVESFNKHRILILDDEEAILFAYRRLIEKEGMCVDSCNCLDGAIQHIKKCHYLAVVADLRLTGTHNEDGLEFLQVLRGLHPATKTILATGHGNRKIEEAARALGVSHYFEKPVQPTVIVEALKDFKLSA